MTSQAARLVLVSLVVVIGAASCSVVQRRAPEDRYCRSALAELTRGGPSVSIEDSTTTPRRLDDRPVAAVTLTYEQGPTKRLMTCFFERGQRAPVRINYRGAPVPQRQLDALDQRIRSR